MIFQELLFTIRLDRFGSIAYIPQMAEKLNLPKGSVGYVRVNHAVGPGKIPLVLPVHNGPVENNETNGFFVEDLIAIASHRIGVLNQQRPCPENELALQKLQEALAALDNRTTRVQAEQEQTQQP